MEMVVDTNIMISALLKDNLTRRILLLSPFDMYTLAYAQEEIQKHKGELISKSKLNKEQFDYLIQLFFSKMNFVPVEDIEPFKDSAKNIMKDIDPDDSPFLALAIMLNALSGAMIVISRGKKPLQSSPRKRSCRYLGIDHNKPKSQRPSASAWA